MQLQLAPWNTTTTPSTITFGSLSGLNLGKTVMHEVVTDRSSQWTLQMTKFTVNQTKFSTEA